MELSLHYLTMEHLERKTFALKQFWAEEDGQDLIEYAFLLAFLGVVAIAMLHGIGFTVNNMWTAISGVCAQAASAAAS